MSDKQLVSRISNLFQEKFGTLTCMVRSPGRINLIGEHTDYNGGFVLPASIDKAIYLAISKRDDQEIHMVAADLNETFIADLHNLSFTPRQWPNYLLGVFDQLQKNGFLLAGCNMVMGGDVPLGAGLSSSAAVECATVFALNEQFALGLSKKQMVQLAQKAENAFVGVQCGIMDQFASMMGKQKKVIRLDCRSLAYDYMPFDYGGIELILFDTGVKHSLASSAYNQRREECEEGVRIVRQKYPSVTSLREVNLSMAEECLAAGDRKVYQRCRYVISEIQRLLEGCEDLKRQDLVSFGQKMFATHEGLSQSYEVSCPEADALVNLVKQTDTVLGARMMGGGFGGCTLNLVKKEGSDELVTTTAAKYANLFDRELKIYKVNIDEGTSLLTPSFNNKTS